MSIIYDNLEKLHGKVYQSDKCIGSCVPFSYQNKVYALTCHHVLFEENNFDSISDFKNIHILINAVNFSISKIVTEQHISKKTDVLVLELYAQDMTYPLPDISLLIDVDAKNIYQQEHAIVVCHPNETSISTVSLGPHVRSSGKHDIEGVVDKGTFFNQSKGRGGAKEYAGVSGSGLFINIDEKIFVLGLLSKIPINSISEKVILKRLDSLSEMFSESYAFSDLQKPVAILQEKPLAQAAIRDVCFLNYTERSKEYYCERSCDNEFRSNIDYKVNTWLYGRSGTGKTALVTRNLKEHNVNHIACDLEPVTIDSCDSIFRGIVDDITQHLDNAHSPTKLDVKSICLFLQHCDLEDNTVITIDEMSCSKPEIIEEFCQKAMKLVRYYQKLEPDKNIAFVISSIFDPKEHGGNRGKLVEAFEFLCTSDWSNDIESLFNIQNIALGDKICNKGKEIILKHCNETPRLLSMIVQKIYRNNDFNIDSVIKITECVISEYNEHE